jgi:hypothetical protein
MSYFVVVFGLLVGILTLIHRTMVRKIYEADGTALSTFSLPLAVRREYKRRFGVDYLYRSSALMPVAIFLIVIFGWYRVFIR